jgi:hypothetical protein
MDSWEALAVLALVTVATAAGGAAVRLMGILGTRSVVVTVLLVAALLLSVVLGTAWSLNRATTTYW